MSFIPENQRTTAAFLRTPEAHPRATRETMTAEEWQRIHLDYTTRINGQPYVLRWTSLGSALAPVHLTR